MKWIYCFQQWHRDADPGELRCPIWINMRHVKALEVMSPSLSWVYVNLSGHTGRFITRARPEDIITMSENMRFETREPE